MNCFKFPAFLSGSFSGMGLLLLSFCLIFSGLPSVYGQQSPSVKVAIIVSKNIRPYLQAVEGLEQGLAANPAVNTQIFNLEPLDDVHKVDPLGEADVNEFALFMAIGPEAGRYTWKGINRRAAPKIYCMILNPENVIDQKENACGIPLNIAVQTQIATISRGLPLVRRLGLLHDPQHNARFLRKATAAASSSDLTVVPIAVSSKKEIPSALEDKWSQMDALWLIPDRTVISESIVAYLIKEAFLQNIPVIGYNRFFYETGAALAFVFDYVELGRQCAQEALRILSGEGCRETPPRFHAWVNKKILEKLGQSPPDAYLPPLQPGP